MKILYFSQFYWPEPIAGAFRAAEHAANWAEAGHEVTVFTGFPNYPTGKIFDGYQVTSLQEECLDGVRVLRSRLTAKPNTNLLNRLENMLSFLFWGMVNILFRGKRIGRGYDVVLGTSGPVFAAVLGWVYAWLHRLPFVLELRDITYWAMQAVGKRENSPAVQVMRWLELFLCRRAKQIVVVTEGFREVLIQEGIPEDKITVITNGVDVREVQFTDACKENFLLSYFGTLGISQNLADTFPYAGEIASVCDSFAYLIIGEGAQRKQLEQIIGKGEYPFVELMRGMPLERLEAYYQKSMLSVITLRNSEKFRHTLPSKLFQVMGRGLAVLYIGPDGEAAELVRKYHAGIVLTGTYEANCGLLRQFFSQEDWMAQLAEMGRNGAAAVKQNYSRRDLAHKYAALLAACRK